MADTNDSVADYYTTLKGQPTAHQLSEQRQAESHLEQA